MRKASGFPEDNWESGGFASGGVAAKRIVSLTESRRLSAREAAEPQPMQRYSKDIQAGKAHNAEVQQRPRGGNAATDAEVQRRHN